MFSGMVGSGCIRYVVIGMGIYFSQDNMCRVLENFRAAFAVSAKDCGVILLLWSCVESRVKVCEMLATFLASADVKASLVWGSFKRLEW